MSTVIVQYLYGTKQKQFYFFREREEDKDLEAMMSTKGFAFSPVSYTGKMKIPNMRDLVNESTC